MFGDVPQGVLQKLGMFKDVMIDKIVQDDDITRLLTHSGADALTQPILKDEQKEVLRRRGPARQIFPYRIYNEGFIDEKNTYITLDTDVYVSKVSATKFTRTADVLITFNVFCDVDILEVREGVRLDLISAGLDRLFTGLNHELLGMGKVELNGKQTLVFHATSWMAHEVTFKITDWRW